MTGKGCDLSAFDGSRRSQTWRASETSIQDDRAKDSAYCMVLLAKAELSDRRGARLGKLKNANRF
jgi:hypothetical protein